MTELQRLQRIRESIEALMEAEECNANADTRGAFSKTIARAKSDAYDQALRLVEAEIIKAEQETR